ncbi:MAG: cytochrome P450 [Candidatus Binataceae bacterium]
MMITQEALSLDNLDIIGPGHYQQHGYPHREWAYLRAHDPVFWCEHPNTRPFWAITKHADIVWISRQPRLFLNGPRQQVFVYESGMKPGGKKPFRHLLDMDPPDHGEYRAIMSRYFTPRAIRKLQPTVEAIMNATLDALMDRTGCDFVRDVSAKIPLAVIAEMMGVPREDWERLFRWTNEAIGGLDPEFQAGAAAPDTYERGRKGIFDYFADLAARRVKNPTDDLASVVANAKIGGAAIPRFEMLSYFYLLFIAGNETTRNATTGGMLAFIENPDEWNQLKRNPVAIKSAVEEILRWTSPVIQFARTAAEDTEIRGRKIKASESLCLFYPSANRDEEVFVEPSRFSISRDPNPHLAFGIGEHFCLGAHLARLELEVIFRALAERMERIEQAGPVERLRSSFIGGIKHLPIRYRIRPAGAA